MEIHLPVAYDRTGRPQLHPPHTTEEGADGAGAHALDQDPSLCSYEVITYDLIED
jgi:hypothetical protein